MRKKTLIDKQYKKLAEQKCYFCDVNDYNLLDVHRIIPGEKGGVYSEHNSICCCKNCHALTHSGKIKIDRKYFSSTGKWILHYWQNGQEFWR